MSKSQNAPLCIFVWKKHHLIQKVMRNVISSKFFNKTKIYIFVDKAKQNSPHVYENNLLIKKIKNYRKYKNIKIYFRKKNFGLAKNIISGVNQVISKYKKVIVLEDDLLISKDFFIYMNQSLNNYQKYNKVLSISGFNHSRYSNFLNTNYKYDNFFHLRPCSWGWATWNDRWKLYNKKISLKNIKKNEFEIKKKLGFDVYKSLIDINQKKQSLWAANWCYTALKNDKYTSYPKLSKISNIGFDGSGQGGYSRSFKNKFSNIKKKFFLLNKVYQNNYDSKIFLDYFVGNIYLNILKSIIPNKLKKIIKYQYHLLKNVTKHG